MSYLNSNRELVIVTTLLVVIAAGIVFLGVRSEQNFEKLRHHAMEIDAIHGLKVISHDELRNWCIETELLNKGWKCAPIPYNEFDDYYPRAVF